MNEPLVLDFLTCRACIANDCHATCAFAKLKSSATAHYALRRPSL